MTTLQQNLPPIHCYEIWEYADVIRGRIIDEKSWWQALKDYPVSYDLRGREAHFILLTNDAYITRDDAINFAKAVHEGKVRRYTVDLMPCNPKPKK